MKELKGQLQELISYYGSVRQVGHTESVVDGAKEKDAIVITHDVDMGKRLEKFYDHDKYISLRQIYNGGLRGRNTPLVMDNCALYLLLNDCLNTIKELEEELKKKNNE